jgi:hypothetical protein
MEELQSLAGGTVVVKGKGSQIEPGEGIHLLRHWQGLTAFLRLPNAPVDNKVRERAIKRAVLHRKNALYLMLHCHLLTYFARGGVTACRRRRAISA